MFDLGFPKDWSTIRKLIFLKRAGIAGSSDHLITLNGSLVRFTSKASKPVVEIDGAIVPQQDLHGYGNPWPAGGGKNKFVQCADGTISNVAVTWQSDGGVKLNGLCSGAANAEITATLPAGTYTLSCGYTGTLPSNTSARVQLYSASPAVNARILNNDSQTQYYSVTLSDTTSLLFRIRLDNGFNYQNVILYPQFEEGSSRTTFAPYTNICPITGWTGANVTRTGKNLCSSAIGRYLWSNGVRYVNTGKHCSTADKVPVKGGETFVVSFEPTEGATATVSSVTASWFNGDTWLSPVKSVYIAPYEFTAPSDATSVALDFYSNDSYSGDPIVTNVQLEVGSTASSYSPYTGNTIALSFGSTVYGGNYVVNEDGTVSLTANYKGVVYDGSDDESWYVNLSSGHYRAHITISDIKSFDDGYSSISRYYLCDTFPQGSWNAVFAGQSRAGMYEQRWGCGLDALGITTKDEWKTYLSSHNIQVVYELATPITTTLPSVTMLQTLVGENNMWADIGDITVKAYGVEIVEPQLNSLQSLNLLLGNGYVNNHTAEDVSDDEALDIILGGNER